MQQYIAWAERQGGHGLLLCEPANRTDGSSVPVQHVLTDKGGEFVNDGIDTWYAVKGIVHLKVGSKSSQLNPCERAHQTLVTMTKAASPVLHLRSGPMLCRTLCT